jgi:uncharacterized protein
VLERSFVHLPGVGDAKEKQLWERGVLGWQELEASGARHFTAARWLKVAAELQRSRAAHGARDPFYFYQTLPRDHLWRLVPDYWRDIAYLDIETTGMGRPPDAHSTTITFWFRGQLLQEHETAAKARLIRHVLGQAKVLCTFFGEAFDVPFLRAEFGIPFSIAHLDLCFWLKKLGFRGGLKRIQKQFPQIPARLSMDIDGFDAVRLWRMHRQGKPGALETLLTYNAEDTVVLEPLLVLAYNLEVAKRPELGLAPLPLPAMPELPTRVYPEIYAALRGIAP